VRSKPAPEAGAAVEDAVEDADVGDADEVEVLVDEDVLVFEEVDEEDFEDEDEVELDDRVEVEDRLEVDFVERDDLEDVAEELEDFENVPVVGLIVVGVANEVADSVKGTDVTNNSKVLLCNEVSTVVARSEAVPQPYWK
jgi:hypothetical protein